MRTGLQLQDNEGLMAEELPQWEIRDGVAVSREGVYETGLELRLPPSGLYSAGRINQATAAVRALLQQCVPEGERLRVCVEIGPEDPAIADEYMSGCADTAPPGLVELARHRAAMLAARQREGSLRRTRVYVFCTHTPREARLPRRGSWKQVDRERWVRESARALETRRVLAEALRAAGYEVTPMDDDALFAVLWRWFNPSERGRRQAPPCPHLEGFEAPEEVLRMHPWMSRPTVRSRAVSSGVRRAWDWLWNDGKYIAIVSADEMLTGSTRAGMLEELLRFGRPCWIVMDLEHEPRADAVRALEAHARRLYAVQGDKEQPITDYVDPQVRVGLAEADQALQDIYRGASHVYRWGLSVVLLEDEREDLQRAVDDATSALSVLQCPKPVREREALWTQWLALSPLSGRSSQRLYRLLDVNAADLFPVVGAWSGSPSGTVMVENRWGGVVRIDPFDPAVPAWNGIVVGATGSGKTFFVQSFLAQALRAGMEAVIVDRGWGYEGLARLVGAQMVPLEPGTVSINPFELPEDQGLDAERKAFLLALLRAMLPHEGDAPESLERAILESAVEQAYARKTTERTAPDGTVTVHREPVFLRDVARVLVTMEQVGSRPMAPEDKAVARALATRLQHWTGDTPFGQFVDRPSTVQLDAPYVYLETTGLSRHPELRAVGVLLVADLVWRRVRQRPDRRKIVVVDEAWALLDLPEASRWIVELYRRFRRYGAAVYTVTQSLADFTTETARGILENTMFCWLLQMPGQLESARDLFRLPGRAVEALAGLTSRRGAWSEALAFLRMEDRHVGDVVRIVPTPQEYWAFTTYDVDLRRRAEAERRHGGDFLAAVLELSGARSGEGGVRHAG